MRGWIAVALCAAACGGGSRPPAPAAVAAPMWPRQPAPLPVADEPAGTTHYDFSGDTVESSGFRFDALRSVPPGRQPGVSELGRAVRAYGEGIGALRAIAAADHDFDVAPPELVLAAAAVRYHGGDPGAAWHAAVVAARRWRLPALRRALKDDLVRLAALADVAPAELLAVLDDLAAPFAPESILWAYVEADRLRHARAVFDRVAPSLAAHERARVQLDLWLRTPRAIGDVGGLLEVWSLATEAGAAAEPLLVELRTVAWQTVTIAHNEFLKTSDVRQAEAARVLYDRLLAGLVPAEIMADPHLRDVSMYADELAMLRRQRLEQPPSLEPWRPGLPVTARVVPSYTVDKNILRRGIRGRFPAMRACYERALATHPELETVLTARLVIDSMGRVSSATVESDDGPARTLAACVESALLETALPQPVRGSTVQVGYPLIFRRAE